MSFLVTKIYEDLDLDRVKFVRPTKFVFLCGGILKENEPTNFVSLRDFIIKTKGSRIVGGELVLAEAANKLYEETKYLDLISFEEDIARIAAVIIVITESPGSLAELGAFASYDPLSANLRLIVQTGHERERSFIREGPVRRIERGNSDFVAFFDWKTDPASGFLDSSIHAHKDFIFAFINESIKRSPKKQLLNKNVSLGPFVIILWIVFVSEVISYDILWNISREIGLTLNKNELTNALFCLETARWIQRKKYGNRVYFYAKFIVDPFDYVFKKSVGDNDSLRRKAAAAQEIALLDRVPAPVRQEAIAAEKKIMSITKRQQWPRLRLNAEKRGLYAKGVRQMVTGLVLTPDSKVSIGRQRKRLIHAMLYRSIRGELDIEDRKALQGLIGFCIANEPQFVKSLKKKYGALQVRKAQTLR